MSISEGRVRLYFGDQYLKPAQLLDPLYRHDGTLIIARIEPLLPSGTFYCNNVVPYIMPRQRAIDGDDLLDLAWAEFLLRSDTVTLDES